MSESPQSTRTGSSRLSARNKELDLVRLPSATPSQSTPSKQLPEKEIESLTAPEWDDLGEAVAWFCQLRAAVKSIVYRFLNETKAAMEIYTRNHSEYYVCYGKMDDALKELWKGWKRFISENVMTKDFLLGLKSLTVDLREIIGHMITPRRAPRFSTDEMAEIRGHARLIAIEGHSVFDLVEEAIARLEEQQTGHDIEEQFPPMFGYTESPDPAAPTEAEEESEDEVLASGGIRDPAKLDLNCFDPVWIEGEEFGGDMPSELREMVGDGHGSYYLLARELSSANRHVLLALQMAGSLRTIFWLTGYDDIVEMIDDAAYRIEEDLVAVPKGTRAAHFLLGRYLEAQKIPAAVENKMAGWEPEPAGWNRTLAVSVLPRIVQSRVASQTIPSLYPWGRQQCLPDSMKVVSVKHNKKTESFRRNVEDLFPDGLLSKSGVFFRGLSFSALELTMTFFIPTISQANKSNEFGPGLYVTNDFDYAKVYAGSTGAIMVFRDADCRGLSVWKPVEDDWRHLVAHYSLPQQADETVSEGHREADIIQGSISTIRKGTKKITKGALVPDEKIIQQAFVSYKACERLAASLVAIIYIV